MSAHPFLDHSLPLAIAHRGGHERATENSLEAFSAAYESGLRYLETDVHLTADGVLVAFHDDELDRVTDRTGRIADLDYSEVRAARLHGGEAIPTLDQLLESFPDVRFNIDPKSDETVVALAGALRRHDALGRTCLGAFSDRRLKRLRSLLGGGLCTAAGPREITRFAASTRVAPRRPVARERLGFDCLQIPARHSGIELATSSLVDAAHAAGVQVHIWTVNQPDEMRRLLDLGVDGIFTDVPSVLRAVLVERGEWA